MRWQDKLLNRLVFEAHFCYVINDPDNLCFEPYILQKFESNGVLLVSEDDPIILRQAYEEWLEEGNTNTLIIRLSDDFSVPFDIHKRSKVVDFHINEVISEIDAGVLRCINPADYQAVINAVSSYRIGLLNKTDSQDFLLRHIYKIAPEIIQSEVDLVRLLIRKHYISVDMPLIIEKRLSQLLAVNPLFTSWDFELLVPNKVEFFAFLQHQWQLYLESLVNESELHDPPWPDDKLIVPFDDQDIMVFIDNLFADGLLRPVQFTGVKLSHWAWIGIAAEEGQTELLRIRRLLASLKVKIVAYKGGNADFWGEIAHELGVLNSLSYKVLDVDKDDLRDELAKLNCQVDELFEVWLEQKFGSLLTLPSIRHPNMLHKVPDWLSSKVDRGQKVCLLVMDGMGFQQWALIRERLMACSNMSLEEHYSFAWVPTITSISRQALFSGKRPHSFGDSLLTTSKEEALWRAYWEDKGLRRNQVLFKKKVENYGSRSEFLDLLHSSSLKVAGLVVNFIDEQMHGMKVGTRGLNAAVEVWLDEWQFTDKIVTLIDAGFEVVITADHGNQEAVGCGWPNEGVKAETKGERVRMYRSSETALTSAQNSPSEVIEWPAKKFGLPVDVFPLVSKGKHAFVQAGKKIVGHGGISLHEVVVPLVTIKRCSK